MENGAAGVKKGRNWKNGRKVVQIARHSLSVPHIPAFVKGLKRMNCRKCGKELPPDAPFCCWCGVRQEREKKKALKRANGTGTVYKVSGRRRKPWYAARNKTIIGYYATKTEALEALGRLSGRNISDRYNWTFAQVYDAWKEEHFPKITKSAIGTYEAAYNFFAPLHKRQFRALRALDYQEIIDNAKLAPSTLALYKSLLGQLSAWAEREEIIDKNFSQFVETPAGRAKEKEVFTDAEIAKIEADESETAKIIMMLLATGMRLNELFMLPLDNYRETYVIGGEKTNAGKNRIIPIRPEGRKHFVYFAVQATGPLLLSGYGVGPEAFRRYRYYPLLQKLGIPKKSPHCTRHTYATRARREGMPPEILQRILGHAKYTTTADIYIHAPEVAELVAAVEKETGSR